MKHQHWIFLSGLLWFVAGMMLLYKGLHFIAIGRLSCHSLSHALSFLFGTQERTNSILLCLFLSLGFFKGRLVFKKTVDRLTKRVCSLVEPIRFSQVYPISYWGLIGVMMLFGMGLKYAPIWIDLRGYIDVTIGFALVQGAMLYFRNARAITT